MDNQSYNSQGDAVATDTQDEKKSLDQSGPQEVPGVEVLVGDTASAQRPAKPYSGMGKEDLLYFSDTPFWNRLRFAVILLFWAGWTALLVAVVVLTVQAPRCGSAPTVLWWQKTNFYQIFVDSFYDNDGSGKGDVAGVTSKLDHVVDLNMNALVLSSIYASDGTSEYAYSITDHKQVHPDLGTIQEVENLVEMAHDKEIKVIMEFIPNSVSRQHEWFQNRDQPKYRNYFVWTQCDLAPNWRSLYDGPAWHEDESTPGECYLGQVSANQPDLNLRSESVRQELDDILRFWLDKGVDGFRIHAAHLLYEDFELRNENETCDDEMSYACTDHEYTTNQPENIALIARWRDVVESYTQESGDTGILIADVLAPADQTVEYAGSQSVKGVHLPIFYGLNLALTASCRGSCIRQAVEDLVEASEASEYITLSWLTSGQDVERGSFKKGSNFTDVINMLRSTVSGLGLAYYGEELGMRSGVVDEASCYDGWFFNASYTGVFCRDESRTPMAWSPDGGFVNGSMNPWIDYSPGLDANNVETQKEDDLSHLALMTRLAGLRLDYPALHYGNHIFLDVPGDAADDVVAYVREEEGLERLLVAMNFGDDYHEVNLRGVGYDVPEEAEVLLVTPSVTDYSDGDMANLKALKLDGGQGIILTWAYTR